MDRVLLCSCSGVKPLILDGFGFSVRTDSDNLVVQDKNRKAEVDFVDFRRRYNSVFICNRFGSISFHALNWLVQTDIPVYLLAPDGSINGIVTRNRAFVNGLFRLKQYEAFNDRERRKQIAEAFIAERIRQIRQAFKIEARVKPDDESRLARKLFDSLKTEFESTGLSFGKRKSYGSSNLNIRAKSEVNALLNFGYSVLEGVCRKRLNFSVLDTSIGFLHNPARMKEPLVYDFQELGRTAVEKTILMLIRERQVKKSGVYRLEDMTVRLQPETVYSVSNALMQEFERIKFERFLNENIRNLVKSLERGNPFMISYTSLL